MAFTPTAFNEGAAPGISAAELNKLGTQYALASTKEIFIPTTYGVDMGAPGFVPGALINAVADTAFIEFYVPLDFTSITSAVVVRVAQATATHRLNYASYYGSAGQAYSTHNETLADQDTAETANVIYEQDISGILTSLVAGDYVSIYVLGDATNVPNDQIIGVRFKYA